LQVTAMGRGDSPLLPPPPPAPGRREEGGQKTTLVSLFFRIKTPSLMLVTTTIPLSK
jgi:hypothetical protein